MTDPLSVKTDEDGIPILEHAVTPETPDSAKPRSGIDLGDQEQVGQLLHTEAIQTLLADLAEDLQKLVAWKVEAFLKEEMQKLIHEATERSRPKLLQEIRTQLNLALPELLVKIAHQRGRQENQD
ncbi:MAG: hypothetical protein PVI91_11940 [Gammaproteobacteria bacterium]|jgi:hypothetical protein